jgi:hypothetical protein
VEIVIRGIRKPEDLTYLYFYTMLFREGSVRKMPKFVQHLFIINDSLIKGKNFVADYSFRGMLNDARYFGLDSKSGVPVGFDFGGTNFAKYTSE